MRLADYDYVVDPAWVAQQPIEPRDACRLMVLPPQGGSRHGRFTDLVELLQPGDVLVLNRTQVVPARLPFVRGAGKRQGQLLCLRPHRDEFSAATDWEVLGRPASALRPGRVVHTAAGTRLEVVDRLPSGRYLVRAAGPLQAVLAAEGEIPLPPYIQRSAPRGADRADYQSVFAAYPGAAAAPTASLHFTEGLLARLRAKGVRMAEVVLHVSADTFLPIRAEHAEDVRQHPMHGEAYEVPAESLAMVQAAKAAGRQVVAVGTTALRALETTALTGRLTGISHLYLYPGKRLQLVSGLITNFHQPRSTLLLLVAALIGRERLLSAYAEAGSCGYRFFSYGDAMFCMQAAAGA